MMRDRDDRQRSVKDWVVRTFGFDVLADRKERVRRVLEEAIELAQTEKLTPLQMKDLVDHVCSKPIGDAKQELGGLGITILAYAAARSITETGWSADNLEHWELVRIQNADPETFRTKQNVKASLGLGRQSEK